jgi:hypothetical protein
MTGASAVRLSKAKAQQKEDLYNSLDDDINGYLHPGQQPT